jgi:hypothetical protein
MISYGYPLQNETVAETSSESDPYPSAWHRSSILLARYRIVERPVQVTERNIHSHPGNRQLWLAPLWLAPLWLARFGHTR